MERKDEELLRKLLPLFKSEAEDHLKVISSGLIEIEKSEPGKQAGIIEVIYRESHSLKGAARSVNASRIVAICQSMENVFSALKRKEITLYSGMLDLLHQAVDRVYGLVAGEEPSVADETDIGKLVQKLDETARMRKPGGEEVGEPERIVADNQWNGIKEPRVSGRPAEPKVPVPPKHPAPLSPSAKTVRVSTAKLDSLLLRAEEMLAVKIATVQRAEELRELQRTFAQWKKERAKKSVARKVGASARRSRTNDGKDADPFLPRLESRLVSLVKAAEYDQRSFGAMVDALLEDTKKTLLLPFASLLEIFPRLVRDISKEAGKEVELTASGGEIELDRRVLEEIKDPLIHLVRNCIDHGIEKPGDRKAKNKAPRGRIEITISSRDDRIEIAVSDDGAGIDLSEVRRAAERGEAVGREELDRLDEHELLNLVFRSGITTTPIITDLSGRGLGLAIVKERVEGLNGTFSIDTRPNAGTTIRMVVPIIIATFRGVLVRVGEHFFFLPSANIRKVARIGKEEIRTVENRETILYNGRPVPFAKLGAVLELGTTGPASPAEGPFVQIVIAGSTGAHFAFQVDEIICEQEVLVKNLGPQLSRVRNISGAALVGSGKVVPILNVTDLMISAVKVAPAPKGAGIGGPSKRSSILVVEDSITARALLKTILESAGYEVTTAVDGIDAFTALRTREFELVVSDIEMPRMNGFELTEKIRADKKLSDIPVVLVTALESREDKERGIDAGANAYIVKSSFEQSNLLEMIRRFI